MGQVNTVRGPGRRRRRSGRRSCTSTSSCVLRRWPPTGPRGGTAPPRWHGRSSVSDELKAAGIDTIVDLTVVGLGRDIEPVQEVAAQVDLNIVVATGLYTYNELPHYFDYRSAPFRPSGMDMLDEFFLHDIENGIAGSGVRPGHPQVRHRRSRVSRPESSASCAPWPGCTAARGLPISTHTHTRHPPGARPATRLRRGGRRPVTGRHRPQRRQHRSRLPRRAPSSRLDTRHGPLRRRRLLPHGEAGRDRGPTVRERLGRRMVLSHDAACHMDWFDDDFLRRAQPNWHFLHISNDVLPAMRATRA